LRPEAAAVRQLATDGASLPQVVDYLRHHGTGPVTHLSVHRALMQAFDARLMPVRRLFDHFGPEWELLRPPEEIDVGWRAFLRVYLPDAP